MEKINALKLRNHLGAVLDRLSETGEPVLISKGRKIRAVLVTPEQFEARFLDYQAEAEKKRFLKRIRRHRAPRKGGSDSLSVLRELRGYRL